MMDVYLFGMNNISRLLTYYLKNDDRYSLLGITATRNYCDVSEFCGFPVIPFEDLPSGMGSSGIINCVAYSEKLGIREHISAKITDRNIPMLSYVHHSAVVDGVEFGQGCIIMDGVVFEPYSKVGQGNVFDGGCFICHDASIGDYNWFGARSVMAGSVLVGNRNFIGINASIRDRVTIGSMSTIGMGAVVIRDVKSNTTVVGNPAVEIKESR